jgi:carbon storage regulator
VLVLTRGPGQSLVLAGDIVITVLSARGRSVRLGVEAPPGVGVVRGELTGQSRQSGPSTETAPQGHDFDEIGVPSSSPRRIPR